MKTFSDDLQSLHAESRILLDQSRRLRSLCEQARSEAAALRAKSRAARIGGPMPHDSAGAMSQPG
ncbi:hypothetical protein [Rhodoplanes roseus]|uniref:Uncharacterized protein n=1 Tax=Rhodoplanes roseus TaxID=29409 RepID=A0A327L1U8_9BRAD|nr:hypothetical protein [Rhodoplanes roseus]RAI41678.1 hypothetical protein CH341_21165 [Rhodoplanes roseus]